MYQQQKVKVSSPHNIRLSAPVGSSNYIAYPGWCWRMGNDGAMYHEKIPNPIMRFLDWAWRSIIKSK